MKRFKCPECGSHELEEVQTGLTQSVKVNGVDEEGYLDYGETLSIEGGEVSYYQCGKGHVLPGVSNDEEIVEWLNENGEED